MTAATQTRKNITLIQKLMEFLLEKPVPDIPNNASIIPFSKSDQELNKQNEKLLHSLSNEKKPLVKAQQLKSPKGSWKLTPVNF